MADSERQGGGRDPFSLAEIAAVIVLLVWAGAAMIGELTGDHHVFDVATPVMLILAGALFTQGFIQRNGKDK